MHEKVEFQGTMVRDSPSETRRSFFLSLCPTQPAYPDHAQ